jgi:hypothetical protein
MNPDHAYLILSIIRYGTLSMAIIFAGKLLAFAVRTL